MVDGVESRQSQNKVDDPHSLDPRTLGGFYHMPSVEADLNRRNRPNMEAVGPQLRIIVDDDACPVKDEVYRVSARYGLTVFVVANSAILIPRAVGIQRVVVGSGPDPADNWIAERAGQRASWLCQSNCSSSAYDVAHPDSSSHQAARARRSANAAERLCL